ncbi:transporter substrate-binding domain-containing protein [Pseudobutyrivibrio sp. YE44]|uniref:transporter substrate-binding domain-containing protein n=1 Tax=Pseudobutyrivibrio sp. YE44 TaxID=1520802 RepID=UPI0015A4AE0D|nr:transporter substrate-binding domain-containing protein [Pseudobutyrivibrio sp. YE44]
MLIILGFVLLVSQSPVFASAKNNDEEKVVRVGYYENEIFEEGAEEGAVKTGYAYEYYMKISEYTGWRYEYVYGSYSELYRMLLKGDIDLLAGLAYKEDREKVISYPELAMGSEAYVLVKNVNNTGITGDPATLNGHTIGVLNNALLDAIKQYLIEHSIDANLIIYGDNEKLMADFDAGVIDVFAAEGSGTNARNNTEVLFAFGHTDYYMCVNKKETTILSELNDAQSHLYSDEPYYLSTLNAKYYASSLSSQALSTVERDWISSHDKIHVGYLNNYLPYSDTDSKGQAKGIVKEVIPHILSSLKLDDINVVYKGYDNYDDMIAAIDSEEIDVAFPVAGGLYYSEENGIYQSNALLSSSTDLIYRDVVIYPDKAKFAINKNNRMQFYYVKNTYPEADIYYYDSIEDCLEAVLSKEVDCTTLNGVRGNAILKNSAYKKLSLRQLSATDDRCFGVKIGNEGVLRLLNRGIHILGNDYAENLAYRYTDQLYNYSVSDFIRDYFYIFLLIIIFIVVLSLVLVSQKLKLANEMNERLIGENNAKINFINNMANIIRGPVKEVAEGADEEEAHRLLSIVDDVIDMSNFDNGVVTLSEDKVNIPGLIKCIDDKLRDDAINKNVELTIKMNDIKNKYIIADKARLAQALMNILSNTINVSPKGGHVQMLVEEQKCSNPRITNMIFTIKADANVICEEFLKNAFDIFSKEKTTLEDEVGPALSLAVSKNIIDLMGGNIDLNTQKDTGCQVIVKVPVKINYGI